MKTNILQQKKMDSFNVSQYWEAQVVSYRGKPRANSSFLSFFKAIDNSRIPSELSPYHHLVRLETQSKPGFLNRSFHTFVDIKNLKDELSRKVKGSSICLHEIFIDHHNRKYSPIVDYEYYTTPGREHTLTTECFYDGFVSSFKNYTSLMVADFKIGEISPTVESYKADRKKTLSRNVRTDMSGYLKPSPGDTQAYYISRHLKLVTKPILALSVPDLKRFVLNFIYQTISSNNFCCFIFRFGVDTTYNMMGESSIEISFIHTDCVVDGQIYCNNKSLRLGGTTKVDGGDESLLVSDRYADNWEMIEHSLNYIQPSDNLNVINLSKNENVTDTYTFDSLVQLAEAKFIYLLSETRKINESFFSENNIMVEGLAPDQYNECKEWAKRKSLTKSGIKQMEEKGTIYSNFNDDKEKKYDYYSLSGDSEIEVANRINELFKKEKCFIVKYVNGCVDSNSELLDPCSDNLPEGLIDKCFQPISAQKDTKKRDISVLDDETNTVDKPQSYSSKKNKKYIFYNKDITVPLKHSVSKSTNHTASTAPSNRLKILSYNHIDQVDGFYYKGPELKLNGIKYTMDYRSRMKICVPSLSSICFKLLRNEHRLHKTQNSKMYFSLYPSLETIVIDCHSDSCKNCKMKPITHSIVHTESKQICSELYDIISDLLDKQKKK
jgi:hypothetical protein